MAENVILQDCDCCGNARPTNVRREDIFGGFIVDFR